MIPALIMLRTTMIEEKVTKNNSSIRLDKYLAKLLPQAPMGLIYKQLRKKNIVLNGKKATGNELLQEDDIIRLFFSDETYSKLHAAAGAKSIGSNNEYSAAYSSLKNIEILYEDDNIIALNKPVGILSQKATAHDKSVNEWLIGYMQSKGLLTTDSLQMFKPSAMNRLDRNTSGIILCAKTLLGSNVLSELIRTRAVKKYYRTFVAGNLEGEGLLEGQLTKDSARNIVTISESNHSDDASANRIATRYKSLAHYNNAMLGIEYTYTEVELITGKSHQIRAHLSSIGHPLLGDEKYGNAKINSALNKLGVHHQLLHSYRVEFPDDVAKLPNLNNLIIVCKEPKIYGNLEK